MGSPDNDSTLSFSERPIPASAGVGLRSPHLLNFVEGEANVAWVEVHAENYMCAGGPRLDGILAVREHYPLSLHGVGLSLGSADGVDKAHLEKLKNLSQVLEPSLISEHLSWSVVGGHYLNDLLPLPLNEEGLRVVSENISKTQDFLGRKILIENPSTYLNLENSDIFECDFLNSLVDLTGCGLLLDVNNIYVSSINTGVNANDYLENVNFKAVEEIHIAGHTVEILEGQKILIDTHGTHVCDEVWQLLTRALHKGGEKPVLMEWDSNIPSFDVLMKDVHKAEGCLRHIRDASDVT